MPRKIFILVGPSVNPNESDDEAYQRILGQIREFSEDIFPGEDVKVLSDTDEKE